MKALTIILLFFSFIRPSAAQTGTYRLTWKNGASCTIAIMCQKTYISADLFAWWHTASGRHGAFSGEGQLKNNTCVLKGQDDPDCKITLTFNPNGLKALFGNCMASNLPDDFSGTYKKVTEHLPGDYQIIAAKAYFYKSDDTKSRLKMYLIKGNKISVDLENITDGQWVFINYTNATGKITSGYMQWSALK